MKKVIFYNQIDYLFESFQVLCWLADKKIGNMPTEEFERKIMQRSGADSKHVKSYIALEKKIWNRMAVYFENRMEQINALFGEMENQIIPAVLVCPGKCLIPADFSFHQDVRELDDAYKKLTREQKDAYFFLWLTRDVEEDIFGRYIGMKSNGTEKTDVERTCNIFSYIQDMDVKQETKLRIQEIYLKRDFYFEQIVKLMEETVHILKEYEEEMLAFLKVWGNYWEKVVEEGSFFEKIKGILEVDDDMMKQECCLIPSFIEPTAFWMHIDDDLIPDVEKQMTICRLGIMLTDQFNWNCGIKEEFRVDEIVPICKALGDKSKMDILLFIKDKAAYGSEIAKQFSLTTATVSHHMNKMLQLRLVQADLRDGKVYYRANKEMLQEFLEHTKQMLL